MWYAARTSRSVRLDAHAYPSTIFDGRPVPRPAWVCQAPDGGLHVDRRAGQIDVEVEKRPVSRIEINWTSPYGVNVIAESWLAELADLVDEERIFVGELRRNGRRLDGWATIHERGAPALMASEGRGKTCPICGNYYTTLWGRLYFADPTVVGRPLIVSGSRIFVREDIALSRGLRKPAGAFKPRAVRFQREPGTA